MAGKGEMKKKKGTSRMLLSKMHFPGQVLDRRDQYKHESVVVVGKPKDGARVCYSPMLFLHLQLFCHSPFQLSHASLLTIKGSEQE